jgi:hypothetical protein
VHAVGHDGYDETVSTTSRPLRLAFTACLAGAHVLGACASSSSTKTWTPPTARDTKDDPATLRPGFGNASLETWWPLTAPEAAALRGVEAARAGDAGALLALGLMASGDARDEATYAEARRRIDKFVADVRAAIQGAADDWHRGWELNRAMHRVFFGGERSELGSYVFEQAHLTKIFATGKYNCLSSAVLYVVLARQFGLPVRAVSVPTHVFVELGTPGGKIIEVETTSDKGFDWVHDARFYREDAATWSGNRGLRPVTFEEYQARRILEPYQLMALAMRDGRAGSNEEDRKRLLEAAAIVDGGDVDAVRDRVQVYGNEAVALYEANAWRTMLALFTNVGPAVARIGAVSRDAKTLERVSWATWSQAYALSVVGRTDESMTLMATGWARIDPSWPDAEKLRNNYQSLLNDRLIVLIDKKDYAGAAKIFADHRDACVAGATCAGNVSIAYRNWSIEYENAGDWPGARKVLQDCKAALPGDGECGKSLSELESRHRF